jgi:DNA-directed RNA polymerase sigma subunit (sigma70/sigma32)
VSNHKITTIESMRKLVHEVLATLTPQEAKALRARFGLDAAKADSSANEETLQTLARELAMLKKKR